MALCRAVARGSLLRVGLLSQKGPILHPPAIIVANNHTPVRCLFYKSPHSTLDALRVWKILECLGIHHCKIVRIRRRLKKFTYPWLAYCVPAALILATGDFIAQYHLKPHPPDRTFGQFLTKDWAKGETLLFTLMGFFLVGPLFSKWNLYFYRKLKCHNSLGFLLRKLAVDLFILSPILVTVMALIYGATYGESIFKEYSEKTKKIISEKYKPAIVDVLIFNIISRPLAAFGIFFLAPIHLRRLLRTVYEVVFAAYLTNSFRKHIWADTREPEPEKPPPVKKTRIKGCTEGPKLVSTEAESRWVRYKKWACRNRE